MSFSQRLKDVEGRFTVDQEAVAERFQVDVLRLEQHYQSELKALCENHRKEKGHWEEQVQKALKNAEEQRRTMEAVLERERERISEEWTNEVQEIENVHKEEMEAVVFKNEQLQSKMDEVVSRAQLKEIELSKQLNELHNKLQESLERKEERVSQTQKQAFETELLLKETVDDLKQERDELEAKYREIVSISEKQITERIKLLTERDDLKMTIEELEMTIKKAEGDFELERKERRETISELEEKLSGLQKNKSGELQSKIKELEIEVSQVLTFVEKVDLNGIEEEISQMSGDVEEVAEEQEVASKALKLQDSTRSSSSLDEESVDGQQTIKTTIKDLTVDKNTDDECNKNRPQFSEVQKDNMESMENQQTELEQSNINGDMCPDGEICQNYNEVGCEEHKVPCSTSVDPDLTQCPDLEPHCADLTFENKPEAVSWRETCKNGAFSSRLEAFEGAHVAEDALCETKPQEVPALELGSVSHEDVRHHETVVDTRALQETDDLVQWLEEDNCSNESHKPKQGEIVIPEITFEPVLFNVEDQDLIKLKALYNNASEENILLHEKISLLQQKIEILEILLAHNNEKLQTGHLALEENYSLKVKLLLLMEHIKELESKVFKMADLQIRYEDCLCENGKLKKQNAELEKRMWSLESRVNICPGLQDPQATLVDEISRMREENVKLSELMGELDRPSGISTVCPESRASVSPIEEDFLDLNRQLKGQALTDLEDCCVEFEKQNTKLRRAITDLQDQSQTLTEATQVHR